MLRAPVIVLPALLLAIATATPLTAQRLEVGTRFGYSPPIGTQFQMNNGEDRSWEGSAVSIGALVSYWPFTHFGIQGTVDLRLTRAYETYSTFRALGPPFGSQATFDTTTTQLAASLRVAARQVVAQDLLLTASVGPAMLRLGDAEYNVTLSPYLLHRIAYGFVAGLSVGCIYSSRLSVILSAEYAAYQLQQTGAQPELNAPGLGEGGSPGDTPSWQEFTFSAAVSVRVF